MKAAFILCALAFAGSADAQSDDHYREDRRDELIVGHDEIRGKFRLNGLNQPRLSISRMNGAITIDGMIKFSGRCDADQGHRRF